MNPFWKFFKAISGHFTKAKAAEDVARVEAALEKVAEILPHALPIVEDIALLTGDRTIEEVVAAAEKYAVPVANQINVDPESIGSILLHVATTAVQKNLPADLASSATHLIQTAVQLAVTATKASAPTASVPVTD